MAEVSGRVQELLLRCLRGCLVLASAPLAAFQLPSLPENLPPATARPLELQ